MENTALLSGQPSSYGTLNKTKSDQSQEVLSPSISGGGTNNNNNEDPEDVSLANDVENLEWPYENAVAGVPSSDNNSSPLHIVDSNTSASSLFARRRATTISSIKENYYKVVKYKHFKLFLTMFLASAFFYIAFTLTFLPRTSLSRDFRRFHFSTQLTKPEIYRIYMDAVSQQNNFPELVRNFSGSNSLIGDDILMRSTYTYLDEKLNMKPKLEQYPFEKSLYNTKIGVELYDPISGETVYKPKMKEPCFDSTSCDVDSLESYVFSGFQNYSVKGYGLEVDVATMDNYTTLLDIGEVNLKGKIHIVKLSRNIALVSQIQNAMKYGAIGCIVYNEPNINDEYYFSNNYISRHSVVNNNTKINIPVISLSYNEVQPILKHLQTIATEETSHYKLQLTSMQFADSVQQVSTLNNIIINIPGMWESNEVIIGYQRDLFTYKGFNSAHLVFLELCRGLSALRKKGWKPLRTIKLISFDGDTYDTYGAKKYLHQHSSDGKTNIVYIDIGKELITGNTMFECSSNQMLNGLIKTAAKLTPYHLDETMIGDYTGDESDLYEQFLQIDHTGMLNLTEHGSSSRATVFLTENGIPSVSCRFRGEVAFPHNSNYLSAELFEDLIDPNYKAHSILTQFFGLLVLTIGEREVVEYDLGKYFSEIKHVYDTLLEEYSFLIDKSKERYYSRVEKILEELTTIFNSIDLYNTKLQEKTAVDYPWYHLNTKLQLLFKMKSLNKKTLKIKEMFLKGLYEVNKNPKDLIMQTNGYTGTKIEVLGKLHEILETHMMKETPLGDDIHKYLTNLHDRFSEIKEFTLDIYPYD